MSPFHRIALTFLLCLPALAAAQPQPAAPTQAQQRDREAAAAGDNALARAIHGPADIPLLDQAHLRLPADALWVPPDAARRLLRAWGNTPGQEVTGMVIGAQPGHRWTAMVEFQKEGHVKDDDNKDLNANDILGSLREGAEQGNEDRRARGFPGLMISGWLQPPHYNTTTHQLVWATNLHEIGDTSTDNQVNYNTRTLGRDGYLSVNLLTSVSRFSEEKRAADNLLGGLTYNPGKRYQDFDASTDHVAEYGLAALIGVVALKKLGLIALGTAFVLKFAKIGVLAVVGAAAALRRFLRRAPKPQNPTA